MLESVTDVRQAIAADVAAPARARRFVAQALRAWSAPELGPVAVLCVSELVTNAVLHGCTPASISLVWKPPVLHIEVHDSGAGSPEIGTLHNSLAVGGRGLAIIDALAEAWGIEPAPVGKTVWCALRLGR